MSKWGSVHHRQTTADAQYLAGDVGSEESDRGRDFFGLADALEGNTGEQQSLDPLRCFAPQRGIGDSGCNAVGRDSLLGPFSRKRFGECDDNS